jgi:Chitin synthesis regulation, resistance to Congo red
MSARRRNRMGARPMYGTGWAAAPFGHGQATYNPNYQQQQPPQNANYNSPPTYQQGGYYGANQGYFGGQETGTELREPENTYRGGDGVYEPPTGPPPKKGADGIIG